MFVIIHYYSFVSLVVPRCFDVLEALGLVVEALPELDHPPVGAAEVRVQRDGLLRDLGVAEEDAGVGFELQTF